jgi:3-methylcrotonyl-CoA carboxylase alpha subunit
MEARLYAEDPANGFLPSTGKLKHFFISDLGRGQSRTESGVREGDEISPYYDPMIAKLVVHADSRERAAERLAKMCDGVKCWPVRTNAAFLVKALEHPDFVSGDVDTGLLARELDQLVPDDRPSEAALQSVALVVVDRAMGGNPKHLRETYVTRPNSPWSWERGFRLNASRAPTMVRLRERNHSYEVVFDEIDMKHALWVDVVDEGYLVREFGATFVLSEARGGGASEAGEADGAIVSPMPGKIIALDVRQGDVVKKGQKLLTLEAMKMEHSLAAPFDGMVAELNAAEGAQVSEGMMLARIEKGEGD